jgi:ribosomal protein S18 acetylase RimI-like enzyme
MEILSYRELEHKDDFMILMEMGFGSPLSPTRFEKIINVDIRLKNGPVGFCAVENGKAIGFVGVMDIPTRIVDGSVGMVGGIYDVVTNPGFAKRGLCRVLMNRAHEYFKEKKYPFSFLLTNRTIIAYALYKKMGYVEMDKFSQYPTAFKVLRKDAAEKRYQAELKPEKIHKLYFEYVKDKTGFVVRQKDFINVFLGWKNFDDRMPVQEENGYALIAEMRSSVRIRELVSLDYQTYNKLLDQVESVAQAGVVDRLVADESLLEIYKSRGYHIQQGDHLTFMVKKLGERELQESYGDKFHIKALDLF